MLQVELPPDIHPLPESVNAYVSRVLRGRPQHDIPNLSLIFTNLTTLNYLVRVPLHPRTAHPQGGLQPPRDDRSARLTPRGISPCAGRGEAAPEARGASPNRARVRAEQYAACACQDWRGGTGPATGETGATARDGQGSAPKRCHG